MRVCRLCGIVFSGPVGRLASGRERAGEASRDVGVFPRRGRGAAAPGIENGRFPGSGADRSMDPRAQFPPASSGLSQRPGKRRVSWLPCCAPGGMRPGWTSIGSSFPHPSSAGWKCWSPSLSGPAWRNPRWPRNSTSGQTSEILPAYNAYSPDGEATVSTGLRQLRDPGRLPAARAPGHPGQGPNRHRPLRWFLEGAQAQAGGRAGRAGLYHLFRSQG